MTNIKHIPDKIIATNKGTYARASFLNLNDNNAYPIIQRIEIIENVTIKGSSSILYPRFVELEIASIIETKIRTSAIRLI
ncbi:MAG: hypothetical protein V8R16_00705 [Bacilli bacterium]